MTVETPDNKPAPQRACPACGAAMVPEQDWCLECGTAAPGRLGLRPGWRAAATIVGAVLVLVGGAVAASYAALNDSAQRQAAAPAQASGEPQVAQTPPPPVPPAPAVTAPPAPAPAPAAPKPAPVVKPAVAAATPVVPPKPAPVKTKPAAKPGLQTISLGPDAALVYDPYKKAIDQTDPADSYDGDPKTVFTLTTNPAQNMGLGLDFDLQTAHGVRGVEITTTTPGFRVEVYGTKGKLPPDILDTRWDHLASKSDVTGDEKIAFGGGQYRHVLLWFTTPPSAGPTVGLSEVRILD